MPGSAFFSTGILALGLGVASARADLIVLQPGGHANGDYARVWRFDSASGTAIATFGYENEGFYAMSVTPESEVLVTSDILGTDDLYRFTRDGSYRASAARANSAGFAGVVRGADGNLYGLVNTSTNGSSSSFDIARFDRPTFSTFVANGTGGMAKPTWMIRGPDGHFYVIESDIGIMRFNGATGAPMGVLVPLGRGDLSSPTRMIFGPDGRLYVSTGAANSVLRYEAGTGAFVDAFVTAGSGGLRNAHGLAFGPDGNLYVSSRETNQVLRYNGSSGAFMDVFVANPSLVYPGDLGFTQGSSTDSVWFDDGPPAGAAVNDAGWSWVASSTAPSGANVLNSPRAGGTQTYAFNFASQPMTVGVGDTLFAYVYCDYTNPEIMLSWCDGSSWEHRAYWGADVISDGQNGTASRRYMGGFSRSGQWYRLEVPASLVGLEGRSVQGMAVTTTSAASFDKFGKSVAGPTPPAGPDTTPPVIQIASPANGATVSGVVVVQAPATDNSGSVRVTYSFDGGPASSGNDWATTKVANGSHIIRAIATDLAGNSAEASVTVTVNNAPPVTPTYWVDDDLPAGAWGGGSGGDGWSWITSNPTPFGGSRAHQSNLAAGLHEHYFNQASTPLTLGDNDLIIASVYVDPANPPRELMLSFFDGTSWEHRAFWGYDLIGYGTANTASRRSVGGMPGAGQWVRLEVAASRVGLAGHSISGMGFAAFDGRVTWDAIGKTVSSTDVTSPTIAITAPANAATVSGKINVTVSAADNDSVSHVDFLLDGSTSSWAYAFSPPYQATLDTVTLPNGSHTIRAVAVDQRGNSAQQSISITVDNDPSATDLAPSLRFTSPTDTANLYGMVPVTIEATDDHGIAWVMIRLPDETGEGTKLTAPPYTVSWDTTKVASGQCRIDGWVADTHGQQTATNISVTVNHAASGDTTPPTIAITSPASGATVSDSVTFTVNAADNYGLAQVNYYLNGNLITGVNSPPYGYTWDSRGAVNGTHTLQAAALDRTGHSTTTSITLTVNNPAQDTADPTVAVTAPTNDATVSGNVVASASATDNVAVASVQFYLDGAALQAADTTAPYSITFDSRTVADGSHVLSAIATDTTGRSSARSVVTIDINNAGSLPPPPNPADIVWFDDNLPAGASPSSSGGDGWTWVTSGPTPTSGSRAHQSNLATGLHEHSFDWAYAGAFSVNASDILFAWVYLDPANPPREVMLNWRDDSGWEHRAYWGANLIGYGMDGTASRRRIADLPAAGAWSKLAIPASSVGLGASALLGMSFTAFDGRVTWDATGKRAAGGSDTNSPSAAITAPAAGSTVSGPNVAITASAEDNVGVVSVKFYAGSTLVAEDTSAPFSVNWNTTALANGWYNLTAVARDAAGNQATSTVVSINVDNTPNPAPDTSAPTIYISAPSQDAAVSGSTVSLAANAHDDVGVASVQFRIDGNAVGSPITNPPFNLSWNSTTVANGTHTLAAVVTDTAGNQGTGSQTIHVNNPAPTPADGTPPTVALTAPANNATVSGSVSLSATASDNVSVTSVAFRVDNATFATLGSAPWSTTWNSATVANGSHSLTALARDAAGNATTASVIVSVNNSSSTGAVTWMDSAVPAGADSGSSGGDAWTWVTTNPAPFAGTRVHQSAIAADVHDHFFVGAAAPLAIFTGDTLFVYAYLDSANVPSEIMLSFNDGTWEHRAYWGSNVITNGEDGANSRRSMGALPAAGQWVQLQIPAAQVGLEGRSINGVSFTLVGGRATWDILGKVAR